MEINLFNKHVYVALGSEIDEFRFSQISTNAKTEELQKPNGFIYHQVKDLKSASLLYRKFIKEFNITSSNWMGGRVIDDNSNFIANISYNGRVWDNEDWKKAKEIDIC